MNKLYSNPGWFLCRLIWLIVFLVGCTAPPAPSPTPTQALPPTAIPSPNQAPAATPVPSPTIEPAIPIQVWLTTADQAHLLEPQPDLAFEADAEGTETFYINAHHRYQQMDGFGASMTDSSAWLFYNQLSETQRESVMTALFSPTEGIGTTALRLPMGASDFVYGAAYTYDDMPPGEVDPELEHFSIEHDLAYIIPALQEALRINPAIKIIASPWSAPAWMKTSGELGTGTLQKQYYSAFAQYFVKFIQAYEAEGIPIYAITLQNEPHFEPNSYPGMRLEPADEAELVKDYFVPAFAETGIETKILVWDHNWDEPEYPIAVLDDPMAKAGVDGVAFHCYAGAPLAQTIVHDAHPDVDIYFTECSGGGWVGGFEAGLVGDMKNLIIGATRNWAKTIVKWNLALDREHAPHQGGCNNCDGLVTVDPQVEAGFTPNFDYYSIGHASRFVQPGAYRIASTSYTYKNLESVAFLNPDGSIVVIASNSSSVEETFVFHWGDRAFAYPMPAKSAATFTWQGAQRDPSPPARPTDLRLRVLPAQVTVKWEFSPLAETYTVKRAEQAGGPYSVLASGLEVPEYFDTQITPGVNYYYVVSAQNALGASPDSTEVNTQQ